jgi:hypothetical protein
MPSEGLASPSLAEFAPHERHGRVEPELGPSTVPRTAYATVTSDSPAAAGLSGVVSGIDTEPRLFDSVRREAQPTSAPSRSAPRERPHVGSVFYLLLVGLVATAIIGAFFGIAFSLLTQPKDKTVVGAGLVSPAAEEAVSTRGTTSPGQPRATTDTSAKTALARTNGAAAALAPRRASRVQPDAGIAEAVPFFIEDALAMQQALVA